MTAATLALGDLTASPVMPAALVAEVAEPTPGPTQSPTGGFEAWEVSPGLIGFVPVFLIALASLFLFLSLTKQMRRVAVRQAQRDAEDAAGRPAGDDARPEDGAPGQR